MAKNYNKLTVSAFAAITGYSLSQISVYKKKENQNLFNFVEENGDIYILCTNAELRNYTKNINKDDKKNETIKIDEIKPINLDVDHFQTEFLKIMDKLEFFEKEKIVEKKMSEEFFLNIEKINISLKQIQNKQEEIESELKFGIKRIDTQMFNLIFDIFEEKKNKISTKISKFLKKIVKIFFRKNLK
jgi:hypothetical protein